MKILASILKELTILIRDRAGLAILFIMPMALIVVMALIQDVTFRKMDETRLKVLYLDEDLDSLGVFVKQGLISSGYFEVDTLIQANGFTEEELRSEVAGGKYQIGIVISKGSTRAVRERGRELVRSTLTGGMQQIPASGEKARINIYFDPVIKDSFKQTVKMSLDNYTTKMESRILFDVISTEIAQLIPQQGKPRFEETGSIVIEEIYATSKFNEVVPNAVQHNVPAWAIFAMFFIVIPLTGNIIKERESGIALRIRTMPVSYLVVLLSKIGIYLSVCLVQFVLMLLVGIYILPLFGLPALELGTHLAALVLMAVATGMAATGYGVMLGTVATTHDQAAVFGSVSVIILAAIGGIWVPVFIMPDIMQKISIISPLNWSLDGFYSVLLRGSDVLRVIRQLSLLVGFSIVMIGIALVYDRIRNRH